MLLDLFLVILLLSAAGEAANAKWHLIDLLTQQLVQSKQKRRMTDLWVLQGGGFK